MAKKDFTLVGKVLVMLLGVGDLFLVSPREARRRSQSGQLFGNLSRSSSIVYYLSRRGFIKIIDKNNERFIKLTSQGELEALLAKARIPVFIRKWDGKWRLIIFNIPEESNKKRAFFRSLLKKNGFIQLQQSVYISPFPLNREAIVYLQKTKLIKYIRILKVEEMDNADDLKKKFGLI